MSDIDLQSLPDPDGIETLNFETLLEEWKSALEDEDRDLYASLVPGDLLTEIAQVGAFRELHARADINDQIKGAFLALSWGAPLDLLGSQLEVERPPGASDDEYREEIHRAPRTIGTGSRTRYETEAEAAHPDVLRARAVRDSPGVVILWLSYPVGGDTVAAAAAVNARVATGVDDDGYEIRMITDQVTVATAIQSLYNITAHLHLEPGPDASEVINGALARLQEVTDAALQPGQPVPRSEILAALHSTGIAKVDLSLPAADLPASDVSFYRLSNLTITSEVAAWLR